MPTKKKTKVVKDEISKIKQAILLLALYLEDFDHANYKVRNHVLKVLGNEPDTSL